MSVMARTADIQVSANRGRTTQELHRDALRRSKEVNEACVCVRECVQRGSKTETQRK